ncbi:chromate efflux transporter [Aliigemmobacter aestuarii]|uniref:Chromate efflux transporter n=2 Tax=Aliigemmobacter aestuarii TaxID=1445661 RepID=A0A4S3ML38_9RHOB|nr:chromate efflux transporter [Gemmobacter aestuarii]THD82493.1 chromate efflux transporter [Gemmobacter aestuarii]
MQAPPLYPELLRVFGKIGLLSFGGPAAQIALMHRVLVDEKRWLTEAEYLRALSFCMLLPGPEAMQLATYAGWKARGTPGGLLAGALFVLPGAAVVLALAMIYAAWGDVPGVQAVFRGVQTAVVIIVIEALLRVARRALKGRLAMAIAVLAFLALFAFDTPFPVVIALAGLAGALAASRRPPHGPDETAGFVPAGAAQTARTVALWGGLWLIPLAGLIWLEGGLLAEIGLFFSQLAVVTFGGAYAVLAWMTQAVVEDKGWLTTAQMMDALGLAETTPGPLILVTEFVGYLAGFGAGGVAMGLAAAVVTLWMTFVPCFLWVFAGAPYVQALTRAPRLSGALEAITAAVVGVIGNLSVWFALHVLFSRLSDREFGPVTVPVPDLASLLPVPALLTVLAGIMLLRLHLGLVATLVAAAAVSVGLAAVGL